MLESSFLNRSDFHCRIFNADGGEAFQCGNGIRCLAYFVKYRNLIRKNRIVFSTKKRTVTAFVEKKNVCVDMGVPNFFFSRKSFLIDFFEKKLSKIFNNRKNYDIVFLGNYHFVLKVNNVQSFNFYSIDFFLKETNVLNFNVVVMEIIDQENICVRVYERGVGETLSCGSGACAAVSVGIVKNLLKKRVRVNFYHGSLFVFWKGFGFPLFLKGPISYVYDGKIKVY